MSQRGVVCGSKARSAATGAAVVGASAWSLG
jgi:hypothetical protein